MPPKIKVTADLTDISKSVLDLGRQLKKVGKDTSPVSIFDARERKFIKEELQTALKEMNKHFQQGKTLISDLISEQSKITKGTVAELKIRKKILDAVKKQSQLSKEISDTKGAFRGDGGGPGGGGGRGFLGGMGKKLLMAAGARAAFLGFKGHSQFVDSAGDRIRAQGLGMTEDSLNEGSPEELARAGMTRRQLIQSRIQSTALGSREAGSAQSTLQRGQFERTFGLEQGQMTDVMSQLRPSLGGDEANDTQMKLQAAIMASGIEDAVGPQLSVMVDLLSSINETGLTNTDQLIQLFSSLSAEQTRTPEQLSAIFSGLDSSIRGSGGERNAMLQMAFSSAGIGGDTIGGTQFAIESGGIMGLDRGELEDRGFSTGMMDNMSQMGIFGGTSDSGGLQERSGAILGLMRDLGGMEEGQSFGDLDKDQIAPIGRLANSLLGTEGFGGLDALKVMEDMEGGQLSREAGMAELKDIKAGKTPDSGRLDTINESLSGTTQILRNIHESLLDVLGQQLATQTNKLVDIENALIEGFSLGASEVGKTIDAFTDENAPLPDFAQNDSPIPMGLADTAILVKERLGGPNFQSPENVTPSGRNRNNQGGGDLSVDVEKGMVRAMDRRDNRRKRSDTQKNASQKVTIQNIMPDGQVQTSTLSR